MKKSLIVMAAAAALCACSVKEAQMPETSADNTFSIALVPDTKVAVEDLRVNWVAGDKILVFHAEAGSDTYVKDGEFSISADNLDKGIFTGTLASELDPDKNYDWYFGYGVSGDSPAKLKFVVETTGVKNVTQVGAVSDLAPCVYMYGVAKNVPAAERPAAGMKHLGSYVCFNLTYPEGDPLAVQKVRLKSNGEKIGGTWYANVTSGDAVYENGGGSQVLAYTTENQALEAKGNVKFYTYVAPAAVSKGKELVLTVFLDGKEDYVTSKVLTEDLVFTPGKLKTVNIEMPAGEPTLISWSSEDYVAIMKDMSNDFKLSQVIAKDLSGSTVLTKLYEGEQCIGLRYTAEGKQPLDIYLSSADERVKPNGSNSDGNYNSEGKGKNEGVYRIQLPGPGSRTKGCLSFEVPQSGVISLETSAVGGGAVECAFEVAGGEVYTFTAPGKSSAATIIPIPVKVPEGGARVYLYVTGSATVHFFSIVYKYYPAE